MIIRIRKYINEKNLFNIFKKIFFFISISYFTYYLISNNEVISFKIDKQFYYLYLLLSFLFCILSIFFNGLAWKNIVIWFSQNANNNNLISFYILTNSLKYVPGGVWHFIERFNFLKSKNSASAAFYINLIEPYFMLSSSLLLASAGVYYSPIFLLFILPSIFLHRNLIYFVIIRLESLKKEGLKIFKLIDKKSQLNSKLRIKSSFPIKIIFIEIIFILFKFSGFILCFYIFNKENNIDYLFIFITFCLAWSVGLIIPGAPGGIGIFEGFFLFLIGNNYAQATVIVSLIIFRFITSFADILLSAPFLIKRIIKNN